MAAHMMKERITMTGKDYNNELLRQTRSVPEAVKHMSTVITKEMFDATFPKEVLKRTNRVILTGCGDSYCAALVAKPVFENIQNSISTGMVPGTRTEAERAIEFTRYYDTYRKFWVDDQNLGANRVVPLVCGVSISGKVKRLTEAMLRTNKYAGVSVAFTDHFDSEFGKAAQYRMRLNVPHTEPAPNVTSYISSTYALTHFGLYYSTVKGLMKQSAAEEQRAAMLDYAALFTPGLMQKIEDQALALSQKWIDLGVDLMDFVGDGPDWATAFFGSAKMVESFGGLTTNDDSEDWNHISYFNRTPEKVGTFIVCNESSPSFRRILETVRTSVALGRPTAVITDASRSHFPSKADVFCLPAPQYKWCNPIMQHIPMDYVAAFTGLIKGIKDFRTDSPLHLLDADAVRFRQSEIVIV